MIGAAVGLAGLALSTYGAYKQGQDAKDVYEYNQALAEYQSEYIQEVAELDIQAIERDVGQFVSRQRAIQGKSGTVANTGSNADSIKASYDEANIDAALIRWRADKDSYLAEKGADLMGKNADAMGKSGYINAATSLLGGLSKWDWKTKQKSSYQPSGPAHVGRYGTTAYGM